ncbi:ABC transporter ATP-binding protein [Micromonospora sp. 4G57]|uniref:ABC transporter ATP-binding protein n=1 Tax=Micromonospora sicca TaxID=2202420 RepID=A0ABU5JMM2_9ACTN|nr:MULTISPECIES: ABC transporter ATP-binding protein [unclassified Micromonospora]MDZ5446972.1 ABC transporter ATP-binding protein [Micromonospora sp. 4G57]MDZ5493649.1 ABC transporter ATP-binding protein [Micromonospora sp. 4G53]
MTAAAQAPGIGTATDAVLTVDNLGIQVGPVPLVEDVSATIGSGERVGLIGESGSGKSLTALALMGLLPEGLRATGSIRLRGMPDDLLRTGERQLAKARGKAVSMVFQEPMTALNPVMRIGDQVAEVMLLHRTRASRAEAAAAAVELLDRVRLPDPRATARAFPHQLSGGQRQRVMLAIALANDPALLICDEPTTALDVTVQAQMLDLILELAAERNTALLFITHDLAVVATVCQRVLVMYGGRVVETGEVYDVFTAPRHRYTEGLIAASDLTVVDERGRLQTIPGAVPNGGDFPDGCVFRTRCPQATARCERTPEWSGTTARGFACWHPVGEDR